MTRFGYVMATYFATMGIAIVSFVQMPLRLVWNASASVPIGLYDLHSPRALHDGAPRGPQRRHRGAHAGGGGACPSVAS